MMHGQTNIKYNVIVSCFSISRRTFAMLGIYYYKFRTRHVKTCILFCSRLYFSRPNAISYLSFNDLSMTEEQLNQPVHMEMCMWKVFVLPSFFFVPEQYIYLYIHIYTHTYIPAVAYMRMNLSKPSWSLAYQFEHQYMKWTIYSTGRWFCWLE